MQTIKIDSTTRGSAKKLLTFCGLDSRQVRMMTVEGLGHAIQRAVNDGLITMPQVERALAPKSEQKNDSETRSGDTGDNDDTDDEENQSETDESSQGGDDGETDGDGDADESESDGDSDSDESSDSESESDSDSDDGDESESDGESESDDGDDGDGESEADDDGDESDDDDSGDEDDSDDDDDDEMSEQNDDDAPTDDDDDDDDEQEQENDEDDDDEDDDDYIHESFDRIMKYVRAGLNVALVGPAGTGKSYLARKVAFALELDFYVNGAMMSKYDLIGYNDAHGTYHGTPAYDAFKLGGLHCFDELDGSAPDAVVAFNGMTDDQPFYTFPCGQTAQHDNYVAIACMNTYGNGASADYVGRYKQDAAAMDRFVRVFINYDRKVEKKLAGKHKDILARVWALREACEELGIRHIVSMRMIVKAVAARSIGKATKAEIDADILFAGLDDNAIAQLKRVVNQKIRDANNGSA